MLFNSLIFTIFLPVAFIGYWLCPARYRNYFLLLASYYFYYSYNPIFLLLLICTSAFDYWCARQIFGRPRSKKLFLFYSLLSNLGILAAFKYSAFFYNSFFGTFQLITHNQFNYIESLVIPAGLSFYTFQSISYTVDVYRGKYAPKDKLHEFLLFVSFFPHMVAGPIVRYENLMPQLKLVSYFRNIQWDKFATLVTWGYFKKLVIADNLNLVVSPVFGNVTGFSGLELLLAGFLFVIQVYCDFSGYSDIATGVARLFNIDLGLNWRRPLLSTSLHEFWRRNHISLTTWFRDYLYIGLGGNRRGYNRWLLNIFIVFVLSGFWHGANLTFIIWGSMHGAFYIVEILLKKKWPGIRLPHLLGWTWLIVFHTLTLIAFRADNVNDLGFIYRTVFSFSGRYFDVADILSIQDRIYYVMMLPAIAILFLKELNEEYRISNRFAYLHGSLRPAAYACLIVVIFIIGNFSANAFIYFQF
jgi:alginate O-acetyltransferase complex protein AlgI